MIAVAVLGGLLASLAVVIVAFYSTVVAISSVSTRIPTASRW